MVVVFLINCWFIVELFATQTDDMLYQCDQKATVQSTFGECAFSYSEPGGYVGKLRWCRYITLVIHLKCYKLWPTKDNFGTLSD